MCFKIPYKIVYPYIENYDSYIVLYFEVFLDVGSHMRFLFVCLFVFGTPLRTTHIHCSKYLKERVCFFIPHPRELIQWLLLKFWIKQWSGRMFYTTASKHLQELWNWSDMHSVENHHCSVKYFEQCSMHSHIVDGDKLTVSTEMAHQRRVLIVLKNK